MKYKIRDIRLTPLEEKNENKSLLKHLRDKHKTVPDKIIIYKKSLDARKRNITWVYTLIVESEETVQGENVSEYIENILPVPPQKTCKNYKNEKIIIIGSGPAGLFCALKLAENGKKSIILERGKPVSERMKDISLLEENGMLNVESNVVFGEGGAGTYSDGKLTARSLRHESGWFYNKLIQFGAKESIKYEAKPHIGTDCLVKIAINMRNELLGLGCKIYYSKKVVDFEIKDRTVKAVFTESGEKFDADKIILATGHSARDIFVKLYEKDVAMIKKGFAVGVRAEHPAELIKNIQYGKSLYKDILPPAEYVLTHKNKKTGRGVYSFCMCPGGMVVNSSSEMEMLCLNGMSNSARNGRFSNAAIVVTVNPEDINGEAIEAIEFQRDIERRAFSSVNGFAAPAQRITSFINGKSHESLPQTSYKPRIYPKDMKELFPGFIIDELKSALKVFDNKMPGYCNEDAILIGVETRTSSPIRILRDKNRQSVSLRGLFPAGECSGYSGGIVSSAMDGIITAEMILSPFCLI